MSTLHVRVLVSDEEYALPVDDVLEVAELGEVTPVPGAGNALLGIRNLGGRVLPVVDLAAVFGLARADAPNHIVVADRGGTSAGLAVNSVQGVEQLPEASEEVDSPYLLGAALTGGALVGVVDVDAVLNAVQGVPVP
jgi:purine-binding chemotaxis protein CheW